ncbi:hypothetical protein HK101_006161, partial [Irineochytrium annulatum]
MASFITLTAGISQPTAAPTPTCHVNYTTMANDDPASWNSTPALVLGSVYGALLFLFVGHAALSSRSRACRALYAGLCVHALLRCGGFFTKAAYALRPDWGD